MSSKRKWIKGRKKSSVSAATRAARSAVKRAIATTSRRRTPMYYTPKNVEKKFFDVLLTATNSHYCSNPAANTAGLSVGMIPINAIPLGTGSSQRIGRNITITSIFYRMVISLETTNSGPVTQMTRTAIVQDKQANGSTPLYTDIYTTIFTGPPAQIQPYSPMNLENSARFKVLSDENRILLSNGAIGTTTQASSLSNVCWIENYHRCNIRVTYNNNTNGDQRDIATNCLYLITIGEFTAAQPFNAVGNGVMRIRYTDD